jgi:hypothetical protein
LVCHGEVRVAERVSLSGFSTIASSPAAVTLSAAKGPEILPLPLPVAMIPLDSSLRSE